jgi:hypothetical protein
MFWIFFRNLIIKVDMDSNFFSFYIILADMDCNIENSN